MCQVRVTEVAHFDGQGNGRTNIRFCNQNLRLRRITEVSPQDFSRQKPVRYRGRNALPYGGRAQPDIIDRAMDAIIESQAQELDPAKHKELFIEVQRRAMDNSHRFVAAGGVSIWTWRPRVKQFHPNFAGFEYAHWSRVSVR